MQHYEIKRRIVTDEFGSYDALKTAIEEFAEYLCDEKGARLLIDEHLYDDARDTNEVSFASEQAGRDFLDQQATFILGVLFAKFQEIVAPALDAKKAEVPGSLIRDNPNDASSYTLREGADSIWIRAENIDAHVYLSNGGVVADLYPAHLPASEPFDSAYVSFAECEDDTSKREAGRPATYTGPGRPALPGKNYPAIEAGAKGLVTPRHKFDVEKDPSRPLCFWPDAWRRIYFFPVAESEISLTEVA